MGDKKEKKKNKKDKEKSSGDDAKDEPLDEIAAMNALRASLGMGPLKQ